MPVHLHGRLGQQGVLASMFLALVLVVASGVLIRDPKRLPDQVPKTLSTHRLVRTQAA